MSSLSGPLQVVPDIDHVTSPENLQEVRNVSYNGILGLKWTC